MGCYCCYFWPLLLCVVVLRGCCVYGRCNCSYFVLLMSSFLCVFREFCVVLL